MPIIGRGTRNGRYHQPAAAFGVGPAPAGCVVEVFRAGNGFEEQRLRRRQIRLQGPRRGPLESDRARRSTSTPSRQARPRSSRAARSARRPASTPAARPRTSTRSCDELTENTVWWEGNRKITPEQFPAAVRGFHRACARQEAVRAGSLWRRRPEIPHQDARLHRARLAFAVHSPAADPSGALRSSPTSSPISPSSICRPSRPIPSATACAPRPSSPSISARRSS